MTDMYRALDLHGVLYKQMNTFGMKCSLDSLKFEMELTQYENADFIYIVRFKKLTGEASQFKDLCTRLLQGMKL